MEIITTEEVMDKLNMFQDRFGKLDEFFWWGLEKNQQMQVRSLPPWSSWTNVKPKVFGLHYQIHNIRK